MHRFELLIERHQQQLIDQQTGETVTTEKNWKKDSQNRNSEMKRSIPTVVFQNPDSGNSSARTTRQSTKTAGAPKSTPGITIDLKKTRYEIMKMSAVETKDLDAETAIAISLGAKPEKRKAVNYKDLMAERREKKQVEVPLMQLPKKLKKPPPKTAKGKRATKNLMGD